MTGKGARQKGHSFERNIVNLLKAMGFEAITARLESKRLDDAGCDIVDNTPYSIQCKAVEKLTMPHHELLRSMKVNGLERPVVFHKRNNKGTVVVMQLEDFIDILEGK